MKLDKREVTQALLLKSSVFVHFNSTVTGVVVPPRLLGKDQVIFQFGLDMPVPIPDLRVTKRGVEGTLSFRGVPFFCQVPWEAVFAVVDENARGYVWQDDMPESVEVSKPAEPKLKSMPTNKNPTPSTVRRAPPKLKVVK